jgi:hypothetical protein
MKTILSNTRMSKYLDLCKTVFNKVQKVTVWPHSGWVNIYTEKGHVRLYRADIDRKFVSIECQGNNIPELIVNFASSSIKLSFNINLNIAHLDVYTQRLEALIEEDQILKVLERANLAEKKELMKKYLKLSKGNSEIARDIYIDTHGLDEYRRFFEEKE